MGRQKKHRQIDAMDTGPKGYIDRRTARQLDEWMNGQIERGLDGQIDRQKEVQMGKYKG